MMTRHLTGFTVLLAIVGLPCVPAACAEDERTDFADAAQAHNAGWEVIRECARSLQLPVAWFAVMDDLADEIPDVNIPRLLLRPHVRLPWERD